MVKLNPVWIHSPSHHAAAFKANEMEHPQLNLSGRIKENYKIRKEPEK